MIRYDMEKNEMDNMIYDMRFLTGKYWNPQCSNIIEETLSGSPQN